MALTVTMIPALLDDHQAIGVMPLGAKLSKLSWDTQIVGRNFEIRQKVAGTKLRCVQLNRQLTKVERIHAIRFNRAPGSKRANSSPG